MQKIDSLKKQNFDWNNIIKHGKSYSVLRMLAYEIGEDKFYKVFKYCLSSFGGKIVTPEMFQDVCEKKSGKDLDWFFQQWYYTNDFLEYEIKTANLVEKNNKFQINCTFNKIGKAQVTDLDIGFKKEEGDIIIKTISGNEEQVNISFETNNLFTEIIIDPNRKLPLINRKDWGKIN
jgi:aminopeptidase N